MNTRSGPTAGGRHGPTHASATREGGGPRPPEQRSTAFGAATFCLASRGRHLRCRDEVDDEGGAEAGAHREVGAHEEHRGEGRPAAAPSKLALPRPGPRMRRLRGQERGAENEQKRESPVFFLESVPPVAQRSNSSHARPFNFGSLLARPGARSKPPGRLSRSSPRWPSRLAPPVQVPSPAPRT